MLLRRVIDHVEQQNWTALGLDFLIVVSGVFIGVQLGNWNAALQTQAAFEEAQQRLVTETQANVEITDAYLADVAARSAHVHKAIEQLRACGTDDVSLEQITIGAQVIQGTPTLRLQMTNLPAITKNDQFVALLSAQERERLMSFERRLLQAQKTLDWLEERPFTNHIENAPHVGFGESVEIPNTGGLTVRRLALTAPLTEVCQDKRFLAPFYLWERTAVFQTLRGREVRGWLLERLEQSSTP